MTYCTIRLVADYDPVSNDVIVRGISDSCNKRSIDTRTFTNYYNEFYLKYFDTCPNFQMCPFFKTAAMTEKAGERTREETPQIRNNGPVITTEMQRAFEEKYHPVIKKFSSFMFENYGDYYAPSATRSKTNPATGEMSLSVAFKNIDTDSPEEMYEMITNDLYGEEIVPKDWEIIDIGDPEIIFDKTGASMNFAIKFKAP